MICEFCDGQTMAKRVRKHHWFHGKLYIIDAVVAEICQECGERYFHAEVLDAIDKFLESKHPVKERIEVEVVAIES